MARVFIMCQGRQRRLASLGTRKQMLEVGGEPILYRTLRLLGSYAAMPEVVCWPDMVGQVLDWNAAALVLEDPGWCILDGIDGIREAFSLTRTVVLLGDVVYSRRAIDAIWHDRRPLVFAVSPDLSRGGGEVFALSFASEQNDFVRKSLEMAPCRRVVVERPQPGHLRNLLWQVMTAFGWKPKAGHEWPEEGCLVIDDWTNDIDTAEDVRELLPRLEAHVKQEA